MGDKEKVDKILILYFDFATMDLLKMLNEEWFNISDSFEFEDKKLINRKEELGLDQDLNFWYKEMKIDSSCVHTLTISLEKKIKADCVYDAMLYLNPESYNDGINTKYAVLSNKIRKIYEDIQKWSLFNSEEWLKGQVDILKKEFQSVLDYSDDEKKRYAIDKITVKDYAFKCSVKSLENWEYGVKKCSFLVWSEAFVDLAEKVKQLELCKIGLKIDLNTTFDWDEE